MRYFEFKDSKSNKFWQIEQRGNDTYICWGKIGTKGQEQIKSFEQESKAEAYMAKLIKEKTAKGYIEIDNSAQDKTNQSQSPATSADTPEIKPTAKTKKSKPPTQNESEISETKKASSEKENVQVSLSEANVQKNDSNNSIEPWLTQTNPFQLPESFLAKALPSRKYPASPQNLEALACWTEVRNVITKADKVIFDFDNTAPELQAAYREAIKRVNEDKIDGSLESDALLFALTICINIHFSWQFEHTFMTDFLVAHKGVEYATDTFILLQRLDINIEDSDDRQHSLISLSHEVDYTVGNSHAGAYTLDELKLRTYLSYADAVIWQSCADKLLSVVPTLHPSRQPLIAVLLPENQSLTNQLVSAIPSTGAKWCFAWLKLTVADIKSHEQLQELSLFGSLRLKAVQETVLATLFLERGLSVCDTFDAEFPTNEIITALAYLGIPRAITILAKSAINDKSILPHFQSSIERFPIAAIVALAQILVEKNVPLIDIHLNQLIFTNADSIQVLSPWLAPEERILIETKLEKFMKPVVIASDSMLPDFLISPPWMKKNKATFTPIEVDVLPFEAEITLTEFEIEEWLKIPLWGSSYVIEAETNPRQLVNGLGFRASQIELFNDALNAISQQDTAKLTELILYAQANQLGFRHINLIYTRYLSDEMALSIWTNCSTLECTNVQYILARFGNLALPGLIAFLNTKVADNAYLWPKVMSPNLAPIVAKAFCKLKSVKSNARAWLLDNPKLSVIGLIPDAIGKAQEARNHAKSALRLLMDHGHETLILACAKEYAQPEVLQSIEAILREDPLDLYPNKITKAPIFWTPITWRRPVLKENGHALSDAAIEHLGSMLRFPVAEGIYEGIVQIKQLCEPNSLADFAWDLFNAWLLSGGPSKESWAFNALGILGTDETARMLTPLIRSWPGEAQHQRAVNGLEILNQIGSDVALMLLNGIAQKIKFKGLQDKAREKIAEIAEARELTVEELEDRIAPTLGLDETGSLTLDFGNRHFLISFDESLKPFVRDSDGNRLKDLPKPKQTDDSERATEATNRYKALKKDARTVASQQILRLELAMCQRRRWTYELFLQFLVNHPLLRYLVQRTVWGVYKVNDGGNFGGELMECFRVAEDGTFTTAEDDEYNLPTSEELRIGIPHALELSAEISTQFSQLFADYELLQPFTQLGRETYSLTDDELAGKKITRFVGIEVPTGKILGLANKGWRRGEAMDGGGINNFSKPIDAERSFFLEFEPGMIVGMLDEYEQQSLGTITCNEGSFYWYSEQKTIHFNQLDPILLSELIRDLSQLTS